MPDDVEQAISEITNQYVRSLEAQIGELESASSDTEAPIFEHRWTFDDGTVVTGINASRTFTQDGVFPVTLRVTDTAGSVATDTIEVTVVPPLSVQAVSLSGAEGERLDFGGSFVDVGTLESHTATVFWGDGSSSAGAVTEVNGSGTVTASHVYADNGVYSLRLEVVDESGNIASAGAIASITNVAPAVTAAADLRTSEGSPLSVLLATFADPGFTNPLAGTREIFTATLNWGDGTAVEAGTVQVAPGSAGRPPAGVVVGQHADQDDGQFTVTVSVIDDDSGSASAQLTVAVDNRAPRFLTIGDIAGEQGEALNLVATFSDRGSADTHTATVDWGDGTSSPGTVTPNGGDSTITASHTYAGDGEFTLMVEVTDNGGMSDSARRMKTWRSRLRLPPVFWRTTVTWTATR